MHVELKAPAERKGFNDALILLGMKKAKDETDRISAMVTTQVAAGLAAAKYDIVPKKQVAKKVKHKPTDKRDVSDIESPEETGDYTSAEPTPTKKTLRRADERRRAKEELRAQSAGLPRPPRTVCGNLWYMYCIR
jgi:hypothetical protein